MSGFARSVTALIALAVVGCAFLPWADDVSAWHLHLRSLFSIAKNEGVTPTSSIGASVCAGALFMLLGALLDSRILVVVGGLLVIAVPCVWMFGNAVSHLPGAIPLTRVQIGAFGATVGGFMALILAAVAVDARVPTTR
jgi:hypothetical protein